MLSWADIYGLFQWAPLSSSFQLNSCNGADHGLGEKVLSIYSYGSLPAGLCGDSDRDPSPKFTNFGCPFSIATTLFGFWKQLSSLPMSYAYVWSQVLAVAKFRILKHPFWLCLNLACIVINIPSQCDIGFLLGHQLVLQVHTMTLKCTTYTYG